MEPKSLCDSMQPWINREKTGKALGRKGGFGYISQLLLYYLVCPTGKRKARKRCRDPKLAPEDLEAEQMLRGSSCP